MSCVQTNTWICERCGVVHTQARVVSPYSDPVVNPPTGWDYSSKKGEGQLFLCAVCIKKEEKK